jgi:PAS domain S-box-containing protein
MQKSDAVATRILTNEPGIQGLWGYLLAAAALGLALICRLAFDQHWGDLMPYTLFFLAGILCIGLTGLWPALLSIIGGLLLGTWFFVSPRHSLNFAAPGRLLPALAYLMNAGIVLIFATRARTALRGERAQSEALRKRSTELEASEKRFQTLAEAAFEGVLVSQQGRILDCNRQIGALVGYSREDILGKPAIDFIAEEQRSLVLRKVQAGLPADYELELICKDGSRRTVEAHGRSIKGLEGESLRVSVIRDITEQKQREQALRRQAALIDLSPDATFVRERGGKILFWSSGAEALYGWSKTEAVGQTTQHLLQTRFPEPMEEITKKLQQSGRWTGELEHQTKSGKSVMVESRWLRMARDGEEYEILESNLDLTERKKWEETMRRRTEELERLMDALPAAVWIAHDQECRTVTGNRAANELVGAMFTDSNQANLGGSKLEHFKTDGSVWPREELPLQRAAATGRAILSTEIEFRFGTGDRAWMLGRAEPLFDSAGLCRGAVAAFVDETERKHAEEALRATRDELALSNKLLESRVEERTRSLEEKTGELNAFCYSLAHDFRAPLRTQEGFARILIEDFGEKLGEQGTNLAWRVLRAAQRQSQIIQDLLAHISVSRSELSLEPVELKEALEQARADLELDLQDKKAEIRVEGLEEATVTANPVSLHLILLNLLTNAFKFVPPNTTPIVRLRTERRGEFLRLWVEDNGIGIAKEDVGKLFGLFHRLNGNIYPGTGMGLAIVKKAAERMGGHVGVESEAGKGSRFWVEIKSAEPFSDRQKEPAKAPA